MIENMQIPVQMYTDALTQPIIAPVQETLTAKQAYGAGAYFIYRSKLYKITAAIGQGSPIVLEGSGANATPGGTVADFMTSQSDCEDISQYIDTYTSRFQLKHKLGWRNGNHVHIEADGIVLENVDANYPLIWVKKYYNGKFGVPKGLLIFKKPADTLYAYGIYAALDKQSGYNDYGIYQIGATASQLTQNTTLYVCLDYII